MNTDQFRNIKVGDRLMIVGNGSFHHFDLLSRVTVVEVREDKTIIVTNGDIRQSIDCCNDIAKDEA